MSSDPSGFGQRSRFGGRAAEQREQQSRIESVSLGTASEKATKEKEAQAVRVKTPDPSGKAASVAGTASVAAASTASKHPTYPPAPDQSGGFSAPLEPAKASPVRQEALQPAAPPPNGGSGGDDIIKNDATAEDDSESDDEEPADETLSSEEKRSRAKMPKFGYFILDIFLAILMMVPFFVLYFIEKSFPIYNIIVIKGPEAVLNPYMEFFRWSLFLSIAYASYSILDFILGAIPTHIVTLANKMNLLKSKRVRRHVGYLRNIHPYMTMTVFFLILLWMGGIFVYDTDGNRPAVKLGPLSGTPLPTPTTGGAAQPGAIAVPQDTRYYVERFLILGAILAAVLAAEKYIIEAIRAKFHRMALAARIQEVNKRQHVVRVLYVSLRHPHIHAHLGHIQNVPGGGDIYLQVDEALNLCSLVRARAVASAIFAGLLMNSSRQVVIKDDLKPYFPDEAECEDAFKTLDRNENGELDQREMAEIVEDLYEDIQIIRHSLSGNARIVNKLDILFMVIAIIVGLALAVPFFDVGIAKAWATFGIVSTAFGFMFQTVAKTCFEALIFVFVEHAFDVGDRVSIDGENLMIQNIDIFTTRMVRWDGLIVYAPNSILSGKYIYNIRRSGKQSDSIQLNIGAKTTTEQLRQCLERAKDWTKTDPKDFSGYVDISGFSVENEDKMQVTFVVEYKSNFQNQAIRNARKTRFLCALKDILAEENVTYYSA